MRTYLLTCMICLACSSFKVNGNYKDYLSFLRPGRQSLKPNVFDVTVHRLSGDRVMITWHAEGEAGHTRFEVMRKHGQQIFTSVGVAEPKFAEDNTADFSFIDINAFEDSSFYCVKKTQPDSVVFFSISRGVEGAGRER